MTQGNLHLTTHRLLFHAMIPPESAYMKQNPGAKAGDAAYVAAFHQADALMSGPVTMHRSSAFRSPRRLWMEVSAEMITTYPNGNETGRVRPLRSILRR